MTGIAIVASTRDAKFAEEVRAGLQAAGLDAAVSQSLPKAAGPYVILIWSAALEAGHAIDAQALIGLWSEDRLLVVRRDEALLPLGLRDLQSLPPVATAAEVCATVPDARHLATGNAVDHEQVLVGSMADVGATLGTGSTGSQEVELELWRAIKDGNDPDDFELYVQQFPTGIYAALAKRKLAELRGVAPEDTGAKAKEQEKKEAEEAAKREAEVKQKLAKEEAKLETQLAAKEAEYKKRKAHQKKELADAPTAKMPVSVVAGVIIAVAAAGGGAYWYFTKEKREAEAVALAMLQAAASKSKELQAAQAKQLESLKALEQARAAEEAARKSGDVAKIKEAHDAAERAEAEAAKQAEEVKQREAVAADVRKKAQDAAKEANAAAAKPAEPQATATAPRPAPTEVAAVTSTPPAPDTSVAAAKSAPQETRSAQRANVPCAELKTRSERERCKDEEAANSVTAAVQRPRSASTRDANSGAVSGSSPEASSTVVSAAPSAAPVVPPKPSESEIDVLYRQARAMEDGGRAAEAVRIYRRAARGGSGPAAKRLGEIFDKGTPGVPRDYAESLQWYETARQLGETVVVAGDRDGSRTVAPVPVRPAPEVAIKSAPAPEPQRNATKPAPAPVKAATPTPTPAPAAMPEAAKAETTAPSPVRAPEPAKAELPAPAPAPAPEPKSVWFSLRGWLIALFVLVLIAWRRYRRREKAAARQARRPSGVATNVPELHEKTAVARPRFKPGTAAPQGDSPLFVSYSHKDRPRVEPIVSVIEEMGRRVWMDRTDITGQTGWAGQIVRAIRECRAVVLMASPNSYSSDQVVRELYLAMNHRKTIVPIEIEPAEMPDELQYILAPFQHHRLSGGETRAVLGRALAAV